MTPALRALVRRVAVRLRPDIDRFLRCVRGVIHVGANTGQERERYACYGLPVVWIEPVPEVFAVLQANIAPYSRQRALRALVSDTDGEWLGLHVASNEGASSSIYALGLHRDVWPQVTFERTIRMPSITLASLLRQEAVDLREYDALVLDTQGAELRVLRGAGAILDGFRFLKLEVPDFEAYQGCCRLADVQRFVQARGWREHARHAFGYHPAGGCYFDVVYRRRRRSGA